MDQQAEYPEEPIYEPEEVHEYEGATVAPPLESAFGKYLREYRLLNSLLLSLLVMIVFFVAMWNLIIYVAIGGEGIPIFPTVERLPLNNSRKTKGRQVDAAAAKNSAHRATNLQNHRNLGHHPARLQRTRRQGLVPRGQRRRASTGNVGTNNDAMKSALKGIGLSLPKPCTALRPQEKARRLRSGGGRK